jgi:hypothetical protein
LIALGFATSGLGLARLLGALLDGEISSYTAAGLGFEWTTAALSAVFLARAASAGERLA